MKKIFRSTYANDNEAFIPELWAQESLAILEENMVIGMLVHRDFSPLVANFGDTVHTRRPSEFTAVRKTDADNVTKQDASATNVPVKLNQWSHTSFVIKDGEASKSFKDLVQVYLAPAMLSQARFLDRILLGRYSSFLLNSNVYGRLGQLSSSNAVDYILGTRNKMNINKAYMEGRNMILTPSAETALLNLGLFTSAEQVGDNGTALREASLGRKFGFNMFMSQNMASVAAGNTVVTGEINLAAGYPAGTTTVTVDGLSAAITNGTWFVIEGDDVPHQVVSTVGGATPTSITFTPATLRAVVDNADLTIYTPGAVNFASGYAADYAKEITVNGFTVAPQIGQFVTFGTQTTKYTVIGVNALVGITLDRPLEAAIAHTDKVNIGPKGEYNLAFHRDAIALVTRPLELPMSGAGARAAVVNNNGFSMRVVITYNGEAQGHLVTLDMLCGTAILDTNLGAVMLG